MENNRNFGPIIILILTVLIAAGGWALSTGRLGFNGPSFLNQGPAPTLVSSLQGAVVEGFPEELILPSDATVQNSSVTRMENMGQTVTTVTYFTAATLPNLFAGYLNYFVDNGYEVFLSDAKATASTIGAQGRSFNVGVSMALIDQSNMRVKVSVTRFDQTNE
jgi:hypothetical protein